MRKSDGVDGDKLLRQPAVIRKDGRNGFSLIELLLVITIIGIMTNVSLAGYSRFQERQGAKSATLALATDLRLVQQKALSGEKPTGWCDQSGEQLEGWKLFVATPTSYQIIGVCTSGSTTIDRTTPFLNGSTSTEGGTVEFQALTGATTSTATVVFPVERQISSGTVSFQVLVNSAGAVSAQ